MIETRLESRPQLARYRLSARRDRRDRLVRSRHADAWFTGRELRLQHLLFAFAARLTAAAAGALSLDGMNGRAADHGVSKTVGFFLFGIPALTHFELRADSMRSQNASDGQIASCSSGGV